MSNEIKDGGPAFPVPNDANVNDQEGMTLRDYFAGEALCGFIASGIAEKISYNPKEVSERCYALACAMITVRGRQP